MPGLIKEFSKGIATSNPVFVMALSLCPVLAVTNTIDKAIGMTLPLHGHTGFQPCDILMR